MRIRLLSVAAAAALIAAPAFAQVGASATSPILPSGAGPVAGDIGVSAGAATRDPTAAATDIASPTSRAAQAAARASKARADEAASAATNSSATVRAVGPSGVTAATPLGAAAIPGSAAASAGVSRPSMDYPSMGGGVVTPTP